MEKSKKTLKMIGICIIGLVIVVAVNIKKINKIISVERKYKKYFKKYLSIK